MEVNYQVRHIYLTEVLGLKLLTLSSVFSQLYHAFSRQSFRLKEDNQKGTWKEERKVNCQMVRKNGFPYVF